MRSTGRALPGTPAVVLDDPRPAAYCVPGRPAGIVLTSAALAVLDPAQLDAVLSHERAHLASRHHWLVTLTSGLVAATPAVPLPRLERMLAPARPVRQAGYGLALAVLLMLVVTLPVALTALVS